MRLVLLAVVAGLAAAPGRARAQAAPAETAVADDERPWLGINISRDGYLGVQVTDVIEDTPAESCGLLPGDEILELDGVHTSDGDELIATIASHRVGDRVRIGYLRSGDAHTTVATLTARIDDRNEVFHRRLVGRPAPTISATWVDGDSRSRRRLDNDGLRGEVVLLLLWSTSCPSCDALIGAVSAYAAEHTSDVRVVALSDESDNALRAHQQYAPMALSIATDLDSRKRFFLATEPLAQPALLVIDRRGVVRFAALDVLGDDTRVDDALLAASRALRERTDDRDAR